MSRPQLHVFDGRAPRSLMSATRFPARIQCWDLTEDLARKERFLCGRLAIANARSISLGDVPSRKSAWPEVPARWHDPKRGIDRRINLGSCTTCRKLAKMEPDERRDAIAERAKVKADRFAAMGAKSKAKREAERVEIRASVALAREDAIAALDAWSDGYRKLEVGKPVGSTVSTDALLMMAIVAYQLERPQSGGDRLWIFKMTKTSNRSGDILCRFCREVQESYVYQGDTDNVLEETRIHATTCALRYLVGMPLLANEFAGLDGSTDPAGEHEDSADPCGVVACDPRARGAA